MIGVNETVIIVGMIGYDVERGEMKLTEKV